ncbi:uncharacterized protein N7473_011079 [Penicillium subrubescens]|uniref:Uncharacterized protein n=1 Tax=Penicillium subrubescens TaxID=1316194 RepID=A0A1Q5UFW4_9EURO|nr:uncharacterized protein N7473_011079 [Penicillium subrubescens]KAJ5882817.1 hypothetical protein N7473_011079 [Penicillium subrubescens]OKP11361.1 hypothetical protein PENSUB_3132 [Penicillium subrubescens]
MSLKTRSADGLVTFVSRYHKGFHLSGDVKVIHQFVPRVGGSLVVRYILLALLFVDRLVALQQSIQGQPLANPTTPADSALWGPDPVPRCDWTSDHFSKKLQM